MEKNQADMMTVEQAFKILEKEEITSSIQVLRRWLRNGNIQGAYIKSRKHGYVIPEKALNEYIESCKAKKKNTGDYQRGFNEGYLKGMDELIAREKKLITGYPSMYEKQFVFARADVREKAKRIFSSSESQKNFLQYLDQSYFSKSTKTPKSRMYVNVLGHWLFLEETRELFSAAELELDDSFAIEERFLESWLDKKRKEYISNQK